MIYVGTDIQLIGKVEKLLKDRGTRFSNHLFTSLEKKYCNSRRYPYMHYAGKFAAKEAVKKAMLSSNLYSDIPLKNIEILNDESRCPYAKINNISDDSVISNLQEIIISNSVGEILIGLPVTLKNNNSEQTNKVNAFIEKLSENVSIPITSYDERLTSISATRSLVLQVIKTGKNKGAIDMTAAAIFLQNYLDEKSIIQK